MIAAVCWVLALANIGTLAQENLKRQEQSILSLTWNALPDYPDSLGVGGPFGGVHDNKLWLGGGANFPVPLTEGGQKTWYSASYWLDLAEPAQGWQSGPDLPRALAYGASVSTSDGIYLLGGANSESVSASSWKLFWKDGELQKKDLPDLPRPLQMHAAAWFEDKLYVAGGQSRMDAAHAEQGFYVLETDSSNPQWKELATWPGKDRILPVMGSQRNGIYLFGGCHLQADAQGNVVREYLNDAYFYDPKDKSWARLPDIPESVAGAPTPALALGQSHLWICGGDNGSQVGIHPDDHQGFSNTIWSYHTITEVWSQVGKLPEPRVTTVAIPWEESWILPSGEVRPGVRSSTIQRLEVKAQARGFGALDVTILGSYIVVLVGIGVYFARGNRNTDEYFRAGKRIPWWAAGLSIFGTQLSAITFMAIPAKVYETDWTYFLAQVCILLIAFPVVFYFLPIYKRLNLTTAYEYLEHRFDVRARILGSLSFIMFQLGRMGIVMLLPALALTSVTGFNVYACILLMGLLATIYTVLGGMEAVIWTDVLQVVVLLGGAALSLVLIGNALDGGFREVWESGLEQNKFRAFHWSWDATKATVWVVLIGNFLAYFVPYATDQTLIQRYMSTADQKAAARSIWTNGILSIPASVLFYLVGTSLFVYYQANPMQLNPDMQTDAVYAWYIAHELPAGLAGLLIAALFAAAMSSLDSSMNSISAVFVVDYYQRFKAKTDETQKLKVARKVTVAMGIVGTGAAMFLAALGEASLLDTFNKILGILGAGVGGLFLLGVFTRRVSATPALIGALTGIATVFVVRAKTDVHFFLYSGIGIGVCCLTAYVLSWLLPSRLKAAH